MDVMITIVLHRAQPGRNILPPACLVGNIAVVLPTRALPRQHPPRDRNPCAVLRCDRVSERESGGRMREREMRERDERERERERESECER